MRQLYFVSKLSLFFAFGMSVQATTPLEKCGIYRFLGILSHDLKSPPIFKTTDTMGNSIDIRLSTPGVIGAKAAAMRKYPLLELEADNIRHVKNRQYTARATNFQLGSWGNLEPRPAHKLRTQTDCIPSP